MTLSPRPVFDLDPARIQSLLQTKRYGRSLSVLETTSSTNDDARAALELGVPDGHVIAADSQRSGRGSRGNLWESPAGVDLYVSIIDRPKLSPSHRPLLSLAAGLGVVYAVETLIGTRPRPLVKWPNDVWLGERKCAGILIESISREPAAVVIGVGLNVNRKHWSSELSQIATSLIQASNPPQELDRALALACLLKEVEHWVDRLVELGPEPIIAALRERLALKGALVRCADVQGRFVGVAENGAAKIATSDGIAELMAGTLRPV